MQSELVCNVNDPTARRCGCGIAGAVLTVWGRIRKDYTIYRHATNRRLFNRTQDRTPGPGDTRERSKLHVGLRARTGQRAPPGDRTMNDLDGGHDSTDHTPSHPSFPSNLNEPHARTATTHARTRAPRPFAHTARRLTSVTSHHTISVSLPASFPGGSYCPLPQQEQQVHG